MSFIRRFWVLILGILFAVGGIVYLARQPPTAAFGWTAYAPLTSVTFSPGVGDAIGNLAILVGAALIAGWVGYRLGRRKVGGPGKTPPSAT